MPLTPVRMMLLTVGAAAAGAMLGLTVASPGSRTEGADGGGHEQSGKTNRICVAAMFLILPVILASFAWWQQQRTERAEHEANEATGGIATRAVPIMSANGCGGCHTISGVPGAQGLVGPRLDASLAARVYIGGILSNNPENMIRWIRAARDVNPRTAMPSTGISEQEARDVAAYLYALK
ncbi:c-type cytochrome [Mesorhizobium sp. M0276]|uniref:c-type cytochrome n=1 Tax=Mesorhizobium sp. M0276 TaxID=2956928 RepID=UPI00333C8A49